MMKETRNPIDETIALLGLRATAELCGVSYQAVRKWAKRGIPRTEWTGETNYCARIEAATEGRVTRQQLMAAKYSDVS